MILEYTGRQLKMFDERRLDDTFYKAFLNDYSAISTRDMIIKEYDALTNFDDFSNLKKAEDIFWAKDKGTVRRRAYFDSQRKNMIRNAMQEYDKCLNNVIISLKKSEVLEEQVKNATNLFARQDPDQLSPEALKEAQQTVANNNLISELYAKGILGQTLAEAFSISKALESTYKGVDGGKLNELLRGSNFELAYNKVKNIDLTDALNKKNMEETIEKFKELKYSITYLKMNLSNTNLLTENEKTNYNLFRKRIRENEKIIFPKFRDEQLKEFEKAEKVLDKESLREVFNNILVSNRVQRKLTAPCYNYSQMDFRNASFCDRILMEASFWTGDERTKKVFAEIKNKFMYDPKTVERANLYRGLVANVEDLKLSNNIFTNGLMIDEFQKRAGAYRSKKSSNKPFMEECKFEDAINNSFDASYRLIHRPPYDKDLTLDKEAKVNDEIAKFLAKEKLHMFMQGVEVSNQMIVEATNGDKEQYDKLIKASNSFSKSYVSNVYEAFRDVVLNNKVEKLYSYFNKNNDASRILGNDDMLSYAKTLAECEYLVYSLDENQFKEFKNLLAEKNKSLNSIIEPLYKDENNASIKNTIDALTILNREHLRSLSLEDKQSIFNRRLYTYAHQYNNEGVLSAREHNEFIERFKGFMDSEDEMVSAIIKEQRFADVSDSIKRGSNLSAGPTGPSAPTGAGASARAGEPIMIAGAPTGAGAEPTASTPAKEPSEDAKAKKEDKKPEAKAEAKEKLDSLKELPDYEKDMATLKDIKKKYSKADFAQDNKKFWNGLGFVACVLIGIAMVLTGAALPGLAAYALGNFAAIGIGAGYFWTKREEVAGPRRADARRVQEIMDKYGIKTMPQRALGFLGRFNPFQRSIERNMVEAPEIYINDAIARMQKMRCETDLYNSTICGGTGLGESSEVKADKGEEIDHEASEKKEPEKEAIAKTEETEKAEEKKSEEKAKAPETASTEESKGETVETLGAGDESKEEVEPTTLEEPKEVEEKEAKTSTPEETKETEVLEKGGETKAPEPKEVEEITPKGLEEEKTPTRQMTLDDFGGRTMERWS